MFSKILTGIDKFERGFNAFVLILSTLILFINVILRYFFSASTSWAEELTRYLIIWISFVGGSICVKHNDHVCVDLIHHLLPAKAKTVLIMITQWIASVFMAVLAYYSWKIMMFNFSTGQISPTLMVPMWIIYLSIVLGSILMAIRFFENTIRSLIQLFSKENVEKSMEQGGTNRHLTESKLLEGRNLSV
jgi:C4-dicarboxylate transporter DctQ subunit